ncbi:MAG: hypothetical protein U0T32_05280 [Chitinophagales bacterium]
MPNFLRFQCLCVHFNSQPKFRPIAIHFYIFFRHYRKKEKVTHKKTEAIVENLLTFITLISLQFFVYAGKTKKLHQRQDIPTQILVTDCNAWFILSKFYPLSQEVWNKLIVGYYICSIKVTELKTI